MQAIAGSWFLTSARVSEPEPRDLNAELAEIGWGRRALPFRKRGRRFGLASSTLIEHRQGFPRRLRHRATIRGTFLIGEKLLEFLARILAAEAA